MLTLPSPTTGRSKRCKSPWGWPPGDRHQGVLQRLERKFVGEGSVSMASQWFNCHRHGNFPWWPICMLGLVAGCLAAVAVAGAPSDAGPGADELLDERLASGEFAPAFDQAQCEANLATRDDRLKRVAQAQARAGERSAALTTIGSMRDDIARGSAVDGIAKQPNSRQPPGGAFGGRAGRANFGELVELIR